MRRKSKVIIVAAAILATVPPANGLVRRRSFFSGRVGPGVSSFMPSNTFCAASNPIISDPCFEVELLDDVSFVALDVSAFLGPNTVWLRLCNVVGRILVLSSDVIRNDAVSPEERAFHGAMLLVSSFLFLRSAGPLVPALLSNAALAVRDRRAYALLFQSVGVSVLQFKTLLSTETLDWVEYRSGEAVELNGEYLYFLYDGGAAISPTRTGPESSETIIHIVDGSGDVDTEDNPGKETAERTIFGDLQFAKKLEVSLYKKPITRSRSAKSSKTQEAGMFDVAQVIVGSKGATMMRISTFKLLQLMKNDDELSGSVQRLVLRCMQEKLSRTSQEG